MPLNRPIISEIAYDLYLINEYGLDCMFVICGRDHALVIDSGMGYCDFRELIKEITPLPYYVTFTHGSVDHTGGWDQFDEVYIHKSDEARGRAVSYERRIEDGDRLRGMCGDPDVWGYNHDTVRHWEKKAPGHINYLYDGFVFDLGERRVTAIYTPAHSPGHFSYLDCKTRVLITGDCCNTNLGIREGYVSQELRSLRNIEKYKNEFDRSFNGHVGYGSDITAVSMPDTVLDDCIKACRAVLDAMAEIVTYRSHLGERAFITCTIYGSCRLNFKSDRLWEPGETGRNRLIEGD